MNNEPIVQVESTIFLVVFIEGQLSWKPHINGICNKLAKSIWIITRLRSIFPDTILRTLYCSLVLPYLSNTAILFGVMGFLAICRRWLFYRRRLFVLLNKNLYRAHSPLFKKYNLFRVKEINLYLQNVFVYKYFSDQLPVHLGDMFEVNSNLYNNNYKLQFLSVTYFYV